MYAFSSTTKNVHREMKNWYIELKQKAEKATARSKEYHPYLDRASDRIVDLSTSLREMSVLQDQQTTSDKATATEPENHKTDWNRGFPTTRRNLSSEKPSPRNRTPEKLPARETKRKKSKMKNIPPHTRQGKNQTQYLVIIIRYSGSATYADMARKLKTSIDIDKINVSVKSMRRSRKGELILQLAKGPMQVEATGRLKDAVTETLGTEAVVEHSPITTLVEIRDRDSTSTEEEVLQAVTNTTGSALDTARVIRMVPSYGGNMMAIAKVRSRDAETLLKIGRLVVGLVRCRVRLKAQQRRCYRCHGFDHLRETCRGKDRTAQCKTCGQLDHKAKDCKENPRCVLCQDSRHDYGHYPGSSSCYEARASKT
ncbi:unnamed protein product [Macrosiphum euphorbiae]|nr:unnamed protein product [Macrosiphum euphorbiae]